MDFEAILPEGYKRKPHDYYAELCVLLTSGSLTEAEQTELSRHITGCNECANLVREYRTFVKSGVSLLAPEPEAKSAQPSFSVENAKKHLLNRVEVDRLARRPQSAAQPSRFSRRLNSFIPASLRAVAAVAVVILIAAFTYYLGHLRGTRSVREIQSHQPPVQSVQAGNPQASLTASSIAPSVFEEQLAAQGREVQRLEEELKRQAAMMQAARSSQDKFQHDAQQQNSMIAALGSDKTALAAERDALDRKLQETQNALTAAEQRLEALQDEHNRQLLRVASLQAHVDELSSTLNEKQQALQRDEGFLASDRDVRELMGARDLYIADVFDIDNEGKAQKPYGRVFYTGGKSLIFYAFDLDRQPGARDASFQAWGRRGPGDKRPLNMGILYLDNAANRRWTLRFDDPKVLSEIDAVFVTVEPRGGRQKPTGKQLLFASLRTPPNHP